MDLEDTLRSVALPLLRFGGFAANALIFGTPAVLLLVLRPSFAGVATGDWDTGRRRVAERVEGLTQAALVAAFVTTALYLVVQATVVSELRGTDIDAGSFASILETNFGRWYLVRFPLLFGLAVLLVGRVRRWSLAGAGDDRRSPIFVWWGLWGLLGLALMATSTFSGHAAVSSPRWAAFVNDMVHLAAAAVWFTGVIFLAVVIPDAWTPGRASLEALRVLAPAVSGFARVAMVAITVVAITGTINSLFNLEAVDDLVDTSYGRVVTAKIVLFLGILALGGVNHYFVRHRLERALATGEETAARRLFRRTIATELAIAIGMMALTGLLVGLARTRPSTVAAPGRAVTAVVDRSAEASPPGLQAGLPDRGR